MSELSITVARLYSKRVWYSGGHESLLSYLTLPSTRTASLVFDPGFVFVIHSHFHLSFTFTSFAAFYFMDELGSMLLNKHAFFHVLAFCSTLNPPQSYLFIMFTSFHVISCFSLSSHSFSLRKLPLPS